MTQSRQSQVSLSDTPYYHCISRCVRRAFLCGEDRYSKQSFEHRRAWVVDRMQHLASIYNIDICAYAVMSNHYHLVLHVDEISNKKLTDREVCQRWNQLYSLPPLVDKWFKLETVSEGEMLFIQNILEKWRERLIDISWLMRGVNEYIARKANQEDKCTGRFWEGRFKSQALLDEDALLTCMAYVDLNPIRAKVADSVETSEYTSGYERIHGVASNKKNKLGEPNTLYGFVGDTHEANPEGLPYSLLDYIELLDWTGRIVRENKRGAINANRPQLLKVLGLDDKTWIDLASHFGKDYQGAVGSLEELALFAEHTGKRWIPKKNELRRSYH